MEKVTLKRIAAEVGFSEFSIVPSIDTFGNLN